MGGKMNKSTKDICMGIKSGKNLEVYIPKYFNCLATVYDQIAELQFTMNYYTLYESYTELSSTYLEEVDSSINELNAIVKDYFSCNFSGDMMESCIIRLDKVRNLIINKMNIITSYVDVFLIYEYVLNRVEHRFDDKLTDTPIEELIEKIKHYIFDTDDQVIINEKIKEIIEQLPIRMTKTKFFDILHDSFTLYKNAECSSFDSYLYMIKTSAMLHNPRGMETEYPNLHSFKAELETVDFKTIAQEEYKNLSVKLEENAAFLNTLSDFYLGMMEVMNPLYALILTSPYAYMDGNEATYDKQVLKNISQVVNDYFNTSNKKGLPLDIEDQLYYTEGKQELLLDEISQYETVFYEIKNNNSQIIDSLMLRPLFQCLDTSQILLGNSLFVELNQEENNNLLSENEIKQKEQELFTQFTDLFEKCSKPVERAIIANTISKVPMLFHTSTEVMDYVNYSLNQCKDLAEKKACVSILESLCDTF